MGRKNLRAAAWFDMHIKKKSTLATSCNSQMYVHHQRRSDIIGKSLIADMLLLFCSFNSKIVRIIDGLRNVTLLRSVSVKVFGSGDTNMLVRRSSMYLSIGRHHCIHG